MNNGVYAFSTSACHDADAVIDAENNWWGVADSVSIEEMVYHHQDNANYPTVDFLPYAESAFELDEPAGIPAVLADGFDR